MKDNTQLKSRVGKHSYAEVQQIKLLLKCQSDECNSTALQMCNVPSDIRKRTPKGVEELIVLLRDFGFQCFGVFLIYLPPNHKSQVTHTGMCPHLPTNIFRRKHLISASS